jgi:hypothetical protein
MTGSLDKYSIDMLSIYLGYQFTCVRAAATPRVGVGAWKCFAIANCEPLQLHCHCKLRVFMYVKFAKSAASKSTAEIGAFAHLLHPSPFT